MNRAVLSVSNCQQPNQRNKANGVNAEMAHETKQEMMEIFKLFDRDNDGSITPDELKHAMNQQGLAPSDEELHRKYSFLLIYFYSFYFFDYSQILKQ